MPVLNPRSWYPVRAVGKATGQLRDLDNRDAITDTLCWLGSPAVNVFGKLEYGYPLPTATVCLKPHTRVLPAPSSPLQSAALTRPARRQADRPVPPSSPRTRSRPPRTPARRR